MKRLLKFAVGLLIAYLFLRLLTEYLRPARTLLDQELVSVPPHRKPPPPTAPTAPTPPPAPEPERLNLNQADATALSTLPGIGPALAERIVAHRQKIGSFASLEDLTQVRGVGPMLVERLRPLVTFH